MEVNILADYLKQLRTKAGLTQFDLDKKAGMPKGTVSQLESGGKKFTEQRIEKIAAALNVSANDFWVEAGIGKSRERTLVDDEIADLSPTELLEVALMVRKWKEDKK